MNSPSDQPIAALGKKWRWLILIILLPILICTGWWGGSLVYHSITFHPKGLIVYECWPERRSSHLCLVNADGSDYIQLTFEPDQWPAWSPDGKRVAFGREINNSGPGYAYTTVLFVMNLDGSNLTQLTDPSIAVGDPSWSPSGDQIVITYSKKEDHTQGIATVNVGGTGFKKLTASGESQPSWSPDGKKIAYSIPQGPGDRNPRIYIMNPDGSNQKQLTTSNSTSASWSPDGTKLAYKCGDELCVMNADGGGNTQLTHAFLGLNWQPDFPSWSPDGKYIAYSQNDPFCYLCPMTGMLWIMRADGSQPTKIADGPVDQNPAWRPVP
jgi:Tol biopolymer transport system component